MKINKIESPKWQKARPDYACIFATFDGEDFTIWQFVWASWSLPDYYLAWCDADGDEWDAHEECKFDEYLVLAKLPTEKETFEMDLKAKG